MLHDLSNDAPNQVHEVLVARLAGQGQSGGCHRWAWGEGACAISLVLTLGGGRPTESANRVYFEYLSGAVCCVTPPRTGVYLQPPVEY